MTRQRRNYVKLTYRKEENVVHCCCMKRIMLCQAWPCQQRLVTLLRQNCVCNYLFNYLLHIINMSMFQFGSTFIQETKSTPKNLFPKIPIKNWKSNIIGTTIQVSMCTQLATAYKLTIRTTCTITALQLFSLLFDCLINLWVVEHALELRWLHECSQTNVSPWQCTVPVPPL